MTELTHFDEDDDATTIDLREHHELTIVESNGFDVRPYNFFPEHQYAFDLRMVEKSMSNGLYTLDPSAMFADTKRDQDGRAA